MRLTLAVMLGLGVGVIVGYVVHPQIPEPMPCSPGPGELSHQDPTGLCAITRKGRLVTRYQM